MRKEIGTITPNTSRTRYLNLFRWMVVLIIFGFLGKMVWEHWVQVKEASFVFQPVPLILSTLIFAFSYFIQTGAWIFITSKLQISLPIMETLESWFFSQLGKYLPGKVWLLVGRFYFYESKGKSREKISVALYLETATLLVAAGLLSLVALLFHGESHSIDKGLFSWWVFLLLFIAFFFLHPRVFQGLLNRVLVLLKREPLSLFLSYRDVLLTLGICVLAWLVGGIGFYLFIDSVFPVPFTFTSILFLTGALAFSNTLGLIALFAPSGLGVREGALVYLLSSMMPGAVAVVLSLLTRLWMTLIEIGLIGVIYLLGQFQKRSK